MKSLLNLFALTILLFNVNAQTKRIDFKPTNKYPEGVAYNGKDNNFFISSIKTGTIGKVDMDGNYTPFFADNTFKSTYGMKVDSMHNLLWVCVSDANYSQNSTPETYKKMARLIAIDLLSEKKVKDIDLSNLIDGKHFANDLAFDNNGNVYVTDSYSPVIYKIDKNDKATVFAINELFKGKDLGLNGIAYHPDGYLIVGNTSTGAIIKVNVAKPNEVSVIKTKDLFPGADGVFFNDKKELILIENKGVDKIFNIASNDGWKSAEIKESTGITDRFQNPSAGTMVQNKLYILNSKLNELQDPIMPPSKEWSLQLAQFKPVN